MKRKKGGLLIPEQQVSSRQVPVEEFLAEQLGADHQLVRPLTENESRIKARREQMERRRTQSFEFWKKFAEPQMEAANCLLYDHEASEEEIAKLRALKPIPHHGIEPLPKPGEPDTHRCTRLCWAWLLQPLRFWPSDLIRVYGSVMLFHPLIIRTIQLLSKLASDPLLVHNPDPVKITAENLLREKLENIPEPRREAERDRLLSIAQQEAERRGLRSSRPLLELGISAIQSLERSLRYDVALLDETEDRERSQGARAELERICQVLAPRRSTKPKSHRSLRILLEFEDLREKGLSEKEAVAEMIRASAREGVRGGAGLSAAAIRSAIRDARNRLGRRRISSHHRGRFRRL